MIEFDHTSDEAYLVFEVTFPFMQMDLSDSELKPITSNKFDAYRAGLLLLNSRIDELSRNNLKVPDHYFIAHEIIYLMIQEYKKNEKNNLL